MYGRPSSRKIPDPPIKDILKWNESKDNVYDYKKSKEMLKTYGEYNKFKYLIDKTKSQYVSET